MDRRSFLLPVALAILVSGCLGLTGEGGSAGKPGKGTIAGRVVDSEGKSVAGARIMVVGSEHNPGLEGAGDPADVAVTESDGSFRTDSLADGYYNLFDSKGQQVAFLDSIGVSADSGAQAPEAVLDASGSVSGVVRLRPGHGVSTVFLVLIGTTTWSVPEDSAGNFTLKGLAEGVYRLRAISTLDDYAPLETLIRVEAGRNLVLPDTLRLAFRAAAGLPILDYPALKYDSALLSVRVSWPGRDPSRVAGYNVYRRAADSGFVRITPAPVKDTFFVDDWDRGFRPGRTYDYAVMALDAQDNEGLKGAATPLLGLAPYRSDTIISYRDGFSWPSPSDIDAAGTLWALADTGILEVAASGPRMKWSYNGESYFDPRRLVGLAADGSGGIYLVSNVSPTVRKYDTRGLLQWESGLTEMFLDWDDCIYVKRDSLMVWSRVKQVLSKLSLDGALLRQDTLHFSPDTVSGADYLFFDPETGPVGLSETRGLFLLDRNGKPVDHWKPEQHGTLRDFAMDERGRWYLLWSDGRIEVYSADRKPVQTIAVPENVFRIRYRYGILYASAEEDLVRIFPGIP